MQKQPCQGSAHEAICSFHPQCSKVIQTVYTIAHSCIAPVICAAMLTVKQPLCTQIN